VADMSKPRGPLLGAPRAEADHKMLARAFVQIPAYRVLLESQDYNYIVGRRGTGKTALSRSLLAHYEQSRNVVLITETPAEHHTIEFQRLLGTLSHEYRTLRPTSRLVWKAHLLLETLSHVAKDYRFPKSSQYRFLSEYVTSRAALTKLNGIARCVQILNQAVATAAHVSEVPARLATLTDIDKLQTSIKALLQEMSVSVVAVYDGLDEGWTPDPIATAVVGGLAIAAADFKDTGLSINPFLFIRDNIFRALAYLDHDFTRHVEGHVLRLHWDEILLLNLVAQRLRVALDIKDTENDVRVWNRFAHKGLRDREGFNACLHNTLYRPRDVLVLLNDAHSHAVRNSRNEIVDEDVQASAVQISRNRLDDLVKEYEVVFPGLKVFISLFHGRPAQDRYGSIVQLLDEAVAHSDYADTPARDFGVFNSGADIATALYSVGFIGVSDELNRSFVFCHDGASSPLATLAKDRIVTVHPCYWKALELTGETPPEEISVKINDEYNENPPVKETKDFRVQLLGDILGALPRIRTGRDDAGNFEDWVLRAVRVLFAGKLSNPQLKPNAAGIQQRDIVATNLSKDAFWRRIYEDYGSRQIVFEVKNYEILDPDDFRQILSYLTGHYGKFAVVVTRAASEVPSNTEQDWLRVMWHQHERVMLILPASILARCIGKLRNPERKYDYTEDTLNKRIDAFARSYLEMPQFARFRKKKRR
jgi:hypothetical protein